MSVLQQVKNKREIVAAEIAVSAAHHNHAIMSRIEHRALRIVGSGRGAFCPTWIHAGATEPEPLAFESFQTSPSTLNDCVALLHCNPPKRYIMFPVGS